MRRWPLSIIPYIITIAIAWLLQDDGHRLSLAALLIGATFIYGGLERRHFIRRATKKSYPCPAPNPKSQCLPCFSQALKQRNKWMAWP